MTTASICTIGDEILIGQIVDTNSSEISRELGALGIKISRMISIGDDHDEIIGTLVKELKNNEIVVTTGGLGPTKDDITKAALAELSGSTRYVEHEAQLSKIHEILSARGLDVLDINRQQAMVPDTCEVILNKWGTAPIMVFRFPEERFGHPATLYSMPGVPFETTNALPDVVEDIRSHNTLTSIYHKTVMTYGMAESALSKKIEAWEDALPEDMHLAYLPSPLTGVRLRLSIYGGNKEDEERRVDEQIAKLKEILGDLIYSESDDTLENAIGNILKKTGKTLSAAESCTGGEISHLLTTVPGSSSYYLGSVTSYAIPVKEKVLGVPASTIREHGVVSSEVAAAMAEGVRKLTGSDYSVATTGFAGPGGGDEHYPEGTVWVGVSTPKGTFTKMFQYHNDRKRNIQRFAASALHFLLQNMEK
ncbi:MAG: CinA family nicotinamide mononucleotide deamidase-related protein [Bacteroidales bacterium]|nr:CinA family nicotinamide mononucleotide deamidase-related protein [Bacteroidales bacterium]